MASLSVEEENYVRMSLLLTGISPRAARIFFDSEFAPACLDATIKKEKNKLLDLKKKHRINQSQWNLLFPRSPDVPDSQTFNVTLMILLLRFLTPLTPPLCGFDGLPSAIETTPAADLARIKHYRNYLAQSYEGRIDIGFFNTAWNDITCAIDRLGGQQLKEECDLLKTRTLDQTNQEIMTGIKQSIEEVRELKESFRSLTRSHIDMRISNKSLQEQHTEIKKSHELLQEQHAKVTKEMEIIKTSQKDTVPWNIRARINHTLKGWKDNDDRMFISTRAAQYVLKCIQENSCVTITASSGVGKTAILRHVALQMKEEGYDILIVTDPEDIVRFYNPNKKTLFVVDDLCGKFSIDQSDINIWDPIMEEIKIILDKKETKVLAACRLLVYQDEKFDSLSVFKSCVCNMLSENICLSKTEKKSIAELYLKAEASEISDFYDIYDCFPLLCKMYHHNPEFNITDFFQNPFEIYESEIDKFLKKGQYAKYCALALCVMFNNKLREELLTEKVDKETRTIIENTCEACKLDRRTSGLILQNELDTLTHTFIKKEQNVYKIVHNKIFDFLAKIYGHTIIYCLMKNADSGLIKERFLLERKDDMDQFITIIPTKYHVMYIQRMVDDWSKGKVQDVFSNINMKMSQFRQKFLCHLNTLDISYQRQLAHTCDVYNKDTALLQCCFIGDIPLIQWCISQGVDINQSRFDGLTPLFAAKGHIEVVKLLLDKKAAIFDLRNKWSKDERIPTEIRNMEQRSIDIYLSALQFGSEKKKNINLKIVGKKGAGKTSLVCRLFGEEFTKVDSTNGIDIHRRKFKIKSDPWTKMEERDKESEFRIRLKKSFVQKLSMNDKDQSTPEFSSGILQKQNPNIAETLHKDEILYERIEGNDNFIDERVEDKDDVITGKIKQIRKDIDVPVQVLEQRSNQPPKAVPQNSKEIVTEFLAISNEVLKDDEDYTTLTLWDFAGDEEFYATHQTFLNPDAVYLVVVNLNDKDEENEKNKHVTLKFWMDTIHCYGIRTDAIHVDHTKKTPLFDPPVIFVGTHTDELENADCSEIISSYMDKLHKDPMQHLRQSYQVSNTKYGNGQFHDIREYIFDLAINSKNYERQYPVKLIRLERVLHDEYKSGRRILSYSEVRDLASKISDFPITDEEELNLFLRYQHEIGYLVFFHDIPEYIILDPQWLIDAFKCIVTVTKFQNKLLVPYFEMWQEVKKTGKISYQLIEAIFCSQQNNFMDHQDHLLAVMEKFDIIINPLVQTIKSHVNSNEETYFYIPWMMKVKETEVDKFFRVKNEFKSTCLCFNFNFLPPYLISHLIVSCIRKYSVASVHKQEGLFKDCCVFDISDNGCTKLLLIKYDNLIQLQIWQWDKDQPCQYKEIFNFIKGELKRIVDIRYRMTTVSFNEKWKCSLTSYSYNCESSLNIFGEMRDGDNFYCREHGEDHQYKDDWFGETSKKSGSKLPARLIESDEDAGPGKKRRKIVSRVVRPTSVDRSRGVAASSLNKKSGSKLPARLIENDEEAGPVKKKRKIVSRVVRPTSVDRFRDVAGSSITKVKVILQRGISEESVTADNLPVFSKEEINFAKMGMIILNVLASVLYDLLKKDKAKQMPHRSKSDITCLYDLLRKLNKHVPSNSSNSQFGPWEGKWKHIKKTDLTIGDDIERIRLTRNEILLSSIFILEDKRYDELCSIIVELLKRFDQHNQPSPELYTDQMNKILAKTISEEEVKDVMHKCRAVMASSSSSTVSGSLRTNYARIGHAAQQLFPDILQELITIVEPSHRLSHDVNTNWYLSNNLRHNEWSMINNVVKKGYANFDIPFIYKLVRNLNLVTKPTQGWDKLAPCTAEVTPGDDIERIRRFRNDILHRGNAQVTDSELSQFFSEFKDIAGRLEKYLSKCPGEYVDKFVDLETCCMDEKTSDIYIRRLDVLKKSDEDSKKRLHAVEKDVDALKKRSQMEIEIELEHQMHVQPH